MNTETGFPVCENWNIQSLPKGKWSLFNYNAKTITFSYQDDIKSLNYDWDIFCELKDIKFPLKNTFDKETIEMP